MLPRDPGKLTTMHLLRCNFKASIAIVKGNYGIYFLFSMPSHRKIHVFSAQLGRIELHIDDLNNTNRKLTEFTMFQIYITCTIHRKVTTLRYSDIPTEFPSVSTLFLPTLPNFQH